MYAVPKTRPTHVRTFWLSKPTLAGSSRYPRFYWSIPPPGFSDLFGVGNLVRGSILLRGRGNQQTFKKNTLKKFSTKKSPRGRITLSCLLPMWFRSSFFGQYINYQKFRTFLISIDDRVWNSTLPYMGLLSDRQAWGAITPPLFFLANYILYGVLAVILL